MRRAALLAAVGGMLLSALAVSPRTSADEPAAQPAEDPLVLFRREFVDISPGADGFPSEFTMGNDRGPASEQPAHRVRIGYAFAVARYEAPQNLWEAVMGVNPSRWQGARNSVERISWHDCQEFCRRVTKLLRDKKLIGDDELVRLPSEAEWEYFARAGTRTAYSFGDDAAQLDDYAWHTGNAAGNDPPVGAKRPNPWQLYDVHGYLWEWCADDWHDDYTGAPADGSTWREAKDAPRAVLRGGSWKDAAQRLTSSARQPAAKELRDDAVGLRCVLAKQAGE